MWGNERLKKMVKQSLLVMTCGGLMYAGTLDFDDISLQIKNFLRPHLEESYGKVDIEVLNHPTVVVPDEKYTVHISLPKREIGLITVPVEIKSAHYHRKVFFSVNIRVFKDVLTVDRSVNRKASLKRSFIRTQEEDITNYLLANKHPICELKDIYGRRTQFFLQKGDVLLNENTEIIPDVLIGDELKLTISGADIMIRMDVEAVEEGFVGGEIKVMHPKYKKEMKAMIVSSKEAVLAN